MIRSAVLGNVSSDPTGTFQQLVERGLSGNDDSDWRTFLDQCRDSSGAGPVRIRDQCWIWKDWVVVLNGVASDSVADLAVRAAVLGFERRLGRAEKRLQLEGRFGDGFRGEERSNAIDRTQDLLDFARRIACALVDHPERVDCWAEVTGDGAVQILVGTGPGELGQVIGRNGQNLDALRTVVAAYGTKCGVYATVDVIDPRESA